LFQGLPCGEKQQKNVTRILSDKMSTAAAENIIQQKCKINSKNICCKQKTEEYTFFTPFN
jgi:hypothetical protein